MRPVLARTSNFPPLQLLFFVNVIALYEFHLCVQWHICVFLSACIISLPLLIYVIVWPAVTSTPLPCRVPLLTSLINSNVQLAHTCYARSTLISHFSFTLSCHPPSIRTYLDGACPLIYAIFVPLSHLMLCCCCVTPVFLSFKVTQKTRHHISTCACQWYL